MLKMHGRFLILGKSLMRFLYRFLEKIFKEGIQIDPNMVSTIRGVFGEDTTFAMGKQLRSLIIIRKI
ncbi:hypothetical protein SLA2020_038040 [Shorea laevis]